MQALIKSVMAAAGLIAWDAAAATSVSIPLTGLRIANGVNQSRTSSPNTIDTAYRYRYDFSDDTMVRGSGVVLGALFPNPTPLADVIEQFQPGGSAALHGAGNNPSGEHPIMLANQNFSSTQVLLGIEVTFGMTLSAGITADHYATFSLTNVVLTPSILVGSLTFTSGSVSITALCAADYDGDGGVTIDDLLEYLFLYTEGDIAADLEGDAGVTIDDLLLYLQHFLDGC